MNYKLLDAIKLFFFATLFYLSIFQVSSQTTVWSEDFESCDTNCTNSINTNLVNTTCVPSGWLTKNNYGWIATSQNVKSGGRSIKFLKNQTGWIMTSGSALSVGVTYQLKFWYRIPAEGSGSGAYKIEVGASTSQSTVPSSLTTVVNTGANSTSYTELTYSFTPSSSSTYYFGLKTSSDSTARDAIIIDDMSLTFTCVEPVITSQSTASQELCLNQATGVTPFTVTASGTSLTYQWYSNASPSTIGGTSMGTTSGAQTNTFTPEVIDDGTKYYYCIVSGICGSPVVSSVSGEVVVHAYPVVTDYIGSQTYCNDEDTVIFSVSSSIGAAYNWQWSNSPVDTWTDLEVGSYGSVGYLTSSLNLINPNTNLDAGTFSLRCVITEDGCSTNSTIVTVSKAPAVSILVDPSPISVCFGQDVIFEVSATGDYFQWQFDNGDLNDWNDIENSEIISGSNSNTLSILKTDRLLDGTSFRCLVADSFGCPTVSQSAKLKVLTPLDEQLIVENNFDISGGWNYDIGTPIYVGAGSGSDDTGIKTIFENKVLSKSYSTNNNSGERASTNTVTFDNIDGLEEFEEIKFQFQVASLGTGIDAGNDAGENFKIEYSIDNGVSWNKIHEVLSSDNLLFALTRIPFSYGDTTVDSSIFLSQFSLNLNAIEQFKFRFSATNNRTNENWILDNVKLIGVKKALTSSWNTLTDSGSIDFEYRVPCGSEAPYHYLISEVGVNPLHDEYHYIKDSIFDGTLDSISYFVGNENLLMHNFANLSNGNYHIGVFDSRGELVFSGQQAVHPTLDFSSESNMKFVNSRIVCTAENSEGVLQMYADETIEGGFEIEIDDINGKQSFGFINSGDEFVDFSSFKFGFHIISNTAYFVKDGTLGSSTTSIQPKSTLRIIFDEEKVSYFVNGTLINSEEKTSNFAYQVAVSKKKKGKFLLKPIKLNFFPIHIYTNVIHNGNCDNSLSSFSFDLIPFFTSSATNYDFVLKNQFDVIVTSGSHTSSTFSSPNPYFVNDLEPGIYSLVFSSSSFPGITVTRKIYLGIETEWLVLDKYALAPNTYSIERDVTALNIFSKAMSRNMLNENQNGWIHFSPVALNYLNPTNNYFTFSSQPSVTGVPISGEAFLSFRKTIATINTSTGIYTPAGVRMAWRNVNGLTGSAFIPVNSQVTILINSVSLGYSNIIIKVNDVTITTIIGPPGILRMKANSNKPFEGFDNVLSSFTCHLDQSIATLGFYKLEDNFDSGNATGAEGKVKFYFAEEYKIEGDKYLPISIFDESHLLIGKVDLDGNIIGSAGTPLLNYQFSDNRHTVDLSALSLVNNKFYILEVNTSTGEKKFLKFIYKN